MVVFEQGAPNRRLYRRFNIKTVQGQDDFASMEEVLRRRFHRWSVVREESEKPGGKLDPSFGRLPDLLIVDGGKGQLGRAQEVVRQAGLQGAFPLIGLAKAHEEIYRPGEPTPIILPRGSHGLHLMQRIRDEAHRVALSQHQTQRTRSGLASQLEAIPGIGPSRRRALLLAFGDVERIRTAPVEELMDVPGISRQIALRVKSGL
jgi:excinuclease ABC subunit C